MIKKIKNLARTINTNKNHLLSIEQQNLLIESLVRETNWGNIFHSAVSGSTWFKNIPLNVGRWAANYSLFYVLYRILNEIKPQNILELGLGETSKMIQAYKQFHNRNSYCTTIEQSDEWIEIKLKNGISREFINIIKADVEKVNVKGFETLVYNNLSALLIPENKKFNLILIDGPWGSANFSRYNIIELLENGLIADDFIIIMDDYNRIGEQETMNELKTVLTQVSCQFISGCYSGEKSQIIIASKNFKYLESL